MPSTTLDDLYLSELKHLNGAESQMLEILPAMLFAARGEELRYVLQKYLENTQIHLRRLEAVFRHLGESPSRFPCEPIKDLLEANQHCLAIDGGEVVNDTGIIGVLKKLIFYQLACYGTAHTLAQSLGHDEAVSLLETIVREKTACNSLISSIAQIYLNLSAS